MNLIYDALCQIRPECDFASSSDFIGEGLLDSFDLVSLVSTLDNQCGISIDGLDILPENFANIESITVLLKKYGVNA